MNTAVIPDKHYFTVTEASQYCDVKQHVLRYWEQEFSQLKPTKRANRRYYQKKDIDLILQIKQLLKQEGYTITGARNYLESLKPQEKHFKAIDLSLHETLQTLTEMVSLLESD